jgi:DHA3 family tetracycline resistance protein-like MFS transporter
MSLLFVKSFYGMLIVFFLWGLFVTFGSGAGEAWVTDNLKFYNKSHILKNYFIKKQSLIGLSLFFAGFIGSLFVNKFGLDIIWPITGFSLIISGIILSFIKEHKITKEKKQNFKDLFKQAKISVKYSLKHNTLFFLIIATFFIMFRDSFGGDLVWQPLLKNLGFPIFSFGFLFSGISLISSIIPLFSNFFLKKFKEEKNYLSLLLFLSIILDILVIFVNNFIIGIVILVAMFITFNLFMPINQAYFQKFVPSKMRATITSFQGMVVSLAYAISSPLSGIIADNIGPKYTIVLGSIFLIPAFILYLKIKQEEEKPETC